MGGLIASIAWVLHAFAKGLENTKGLIRVHPGFLMPVGLALAFLSGIAPIVAFDMPFMTGLWYPEHLPILGSLGSALFFDTGVYLVVVGVTLTIIFTITESA